MITLDFRGYCGKFESRFEIHDKRIINKYIEIFIDKAKMYEEHHVSVYFDNNI